MAMLSHTQSRLRKPMRLYGNCSPEPGHTGAMDESPSSPDESVTVNIGFLGLRTGHLRVSLWRPPPEAL